ncbi:MAG: hypothetical protein GYA31_03035 [Parcubacteria group bacterium]|nr:hypothetical protein [Parcubacteria group bacterium]
MNTQEFYEKKEELANELLYGSPIDIDLHIRVATFLNELKPEYWYIFKGEEYRFLELLTQAFLDQADSDRTLYIKLMMKTCPSELKKEVISKIKMFSLIPYVYNGLT